MRSYAVFCFSRRMLLWCAALCTPLISTVVSSPKLSQTKKQPPLSYVKQRYLGKQTRDLPYTTVYGHPETAKVVLILWTSMACPTCSMLHTSSVPFLKEYAEKNKDFALILRDYPTTPMALQTSAIAWACPKSKRSKFMHALYTKQDWTQAPDQILSNIKKMALETASSPAEKKRIEKSATQQSDQEKLFKSREPDKTTLGMNQVPWAIMVRFNPKKTDSEEKEPKGSWEMRVLNPDESLKDVVLTALSFVKK